MMGEDVEMWSLLEMVKDEVGPLVLQRLRLRARRFQGQNGNLSQPWKARTSHMITKRTRVSLAFGKTFRSALAAPHPLTLHV